MTLVTNILTVIVELILFYALYKAYQIIKSMGADLDYATARIFLSSESVKGIKVLMATLVTFSIFNALMAFTLTGYISEVIGRINLVYLFGGWAYFLKQIADITKKPVE